MSELAYSKHNPAIRWQLLASASALAILANLAVAPAAVADDTHFSIELGGSYGMQAGGSTGWFLPFAAPGNNGGGGGEGGEGGEGGDATRIHSPFGPNGAVLPTKARQSWDFVGSLKFQPADSDLIFSAGVKFGRTARHNTGAVFTQTTDYGTSTYSGVSTHRESHVNLDFQVGKDFGLGMFGLEGSSVFSAGLRYAHFTARTNTGFSTSTKYFTGFGATTARRSFTGVGPMISWEASAPFGAMGSDSISIDWGVNAAVLFGKQRSAGILVYDDGYTLATARSRNATIPELGGFAGLSYRPADSALKVSFGYRVDAAFGVLDGGVFQRVDVDRIEHGPFLKIGFSQ